VWLTLNRRLITFVPPGQIAVDGSCRRWRVCLVSLLIDSMVVRENRNGFAHPVFPKDLQPDMTTIECMVNSPASSARRGRGIESV